MHRPEDFTISVVSHGQFKLVSALLDDLVRRPDPALRRVVLTINRPETEAPLPRNPPFELVVRRNARPQGFARNHNEAFAHCETPWFAVLNPDLRLTADQLGALAKNAAPKDGVLAPRIVCADGSTADSARRLPTPWTVALRAVARRAPGIDADFDWLAGMCLMIRRQAFESLGGFDERYYLYCEDVDLCLRMQLHGWRVHRIPKLSVVHNARRLSRHSLRYMTWHLASLTRLWCSRSFWTYLADRRTLPTRNAG
jgi:N-acetylglucosaminyl-diphospho-decaprenol L-rhamnosyltransferase